MTAPQKRDSIAGYALAFAAVIIALIIVSLVGMAEAAAGGVRRAACNVVHQQAVAAAVPYPVIGYQVGQHLQQQAVDEYGFRASPSQQRLTFLEGYYHRDEMLAKQYRGPQSPGTVYDEATGIPEPTPEQRALVLSQASGKPVVLTQRWQRLTDSGLGSAGPSRPATGCPAATERGQTNGGQCAEPAAEEPPAFSAPEAPAAPSVADQAANEIANSMRGPTAPIENAVGYEARKYSFAAQHPTVAAACASCHSGETPKGELNIAHEVTAAKSSGDCPTILAMVDAIATGSMPKGKPMSEADRLAAIAELLSK